MKPGLSVHFMVLNPQMERFAEKVAYMSTVADEIVIVDTGSSPDDVAKMRAWDGFNDTDVRVIEEPFVDFSATRNKGLEQHTREWTFGMDWDELPSMALMHMLDAIAHRGYAKRVPEYKKALGFLVLTYSWWDGIKGPLQESDWHCRLWRTEAGRLYRPVHELVSLNGQPEHKTRNTRFMPKFPEHVFLIHSKGYTEMKKADEMYATMEKDLAAA